MRILNFGIAVALLYMAGGCGSFAGGMNGKTIAGHPILFGDLSTNADGTTINLGGKHFQINNNHITWEPKESLDLPPNWNKLELTESMDSVAINVDDYELASIGK